MRIVFFPPCNLALAYVKAPLSNSLPLSFSSTIHFPMLPVSPRHPTLLQRPPWPSLLLKCAPANYPSRYAKQLNSLTHRQTRTPRELPKYTSISGTSKKAERTVSRTGWLRDNISQGGGREVLKVKEIHAWVEQVFCSNGTKGRFFRI